MREKLLFDRAKTFFFQEEEQGQTVLYKVYKSESPTPYEVAGFYNEFEILQGMRVKGVRRVFRKERVQGNYALVMEYIKGEPLGDFSLGQGFHLGQVLDVAVQAAEIISDIHKYHVVHHDIKPSNFIFNSQINRLTLIDFGLAAPFDLATPYLSTDEKLKGSLAYISPEQTGRMNRKVDYRSDLYSLGGTLYYLLTGHPPFLGDDPMSLLHAQIAKQPEFPTKYNHQIPQALSKVVMKLLSKNAEDRYQSALSLVEDLSFCKARYNLTGDIPDFELKDSQFAYDLKIPEKLFGREDEIRLLIQSLDETKKGSRSLILLEGLSGTGKSSLVRELDRPVTLCKGYFVRGKFDQLQKNIPYFAITQAFAEFCDYLNTESEEEVARWKRRILTDLEDLGQVLVDMIPSLLPILGQQTEPTPLEGQEAANRLNYVFRIFVRNISKEQHPFILFLDDMQWADNASIELIKMLLLEPTIHHFLMIAAFRDNEVTSQHPLAQAFLQIQKSLTPITRLKIKELTQNNLFQMIHETLKQENEKVLELSEILFQKTRGNPFFAKEFLKILYQKEAIAYDLAESHWQVDISKVRSMAVSASVVDLLIQWVRELRLDSQLVLQYAACIGMKFNLHNLSLISKVPMVEMIPLLEQAVKEGILITKDYNYRLASVVQKPELTKKATFIFSHDRLLEAVYSMMPTELKGQIHASIGRNLLEQLQSDEMETEIFNVVSQFDRGLAWIKEAAERLKLAELFLQAGTKAKHTAAYTQSYLYFEKSYRLLEEFPLENRSLRFVAMSQAAEMAFLIGQNEDAEFFCSRILENGVGKLEKMPALVVQLMMAAAAGDNERVLEIGTQGSALMGEPFPVKPKLIHIIFNLLKTKWKLRTFEVKELSSLPQMTDPQKIWAMNFIEKMIPSAFRSGSNLFPLLVFRMVQISLKHGNTPPSMFGYAAYGISLAGVLKDFDQAYEFGKMSQEVGKVEGGETFSSHVIFVYNNFIRHWKEPLLTYVDDFAKAYQKGVETGYLFEAAWYAHHWIFWSFLYGRNIDALEQKIKEIEGIFRHNQPAEGMVQLLHQTFHQLREGGENPYEIKGDYYDESQDWQHAATEECHYLIKRCLLCFLFDQWDEAYSYLNKFEVLKEAHTAHPSISVMEFLASQIYLKEYQRTKGRKNLNKAKKILKNLKLWATTVPETHLHRSLLIEALVASAEGRPHLAHGLLDRAMQEVRKGSNHLEEGMVFERAAEFYHDQEQFTFAKPLVQWAISAYAQWGAKAKMSQLRNKFGQVLIWQRPGKDQSYSTTESTETASQGVDLLSVVRASQVISGEIHMTSLKDKLIHTVMENAGAGRACLLLEKQGQLWVEADLSETENPFFQPTPLPSYSALPQSIVQYVSRCKSDLVLANAQNEKKFEQDPYVIQNKLRSILCMPILHQGKMSGILYLENNLLEGAFTESHIEILRLISSQIAVSIENASLYLTMEEKVSERTVELNQALGEVQHKNHQIQSSIGYAKNIQASLLPGTKRLLETFADHFIWFEPRELVGGDIFLVEQVAGGDFVILLDCTGHGVPGAFMTMIAGSAIKQILQGSQPRDPAWLLSEVNRVIKTSLQGEDLEDSNEDGLDGGVCFIDRDRQKLTFAGARFDLYHESNRELSVTKGDRKSLGFPKTPMDVRFTNHVIDLQEGQNFYLATDGYRDQTGGPKGFSFGERRFRETLGTGFGKPLDYQLSTLRSALNQWQDQEERKDDICLMGFSWK